MKDWKMVFGTESERPKELDTTSSPTTVYQRRNVRQVIRTDGDGNEVMGWEREERELTADEYHQMILMQEVVESSKNDIMAFQKQEVIDEYTLQLIEEGII